MKENKSVIISSTLRALMVAAGLVLTLPAMAQNLANAGDMSLVARNQASKEPQGLRQAAEQGLKSMVAELGRDIAGRDVRHQCRRGERVPRVVGPAPANP